jgi:phosphate starvation-inducible PhoH-like protein
MGDIQLGDQVYGRDGKLHKVIGVFPQGKRPVYKMTFTDGSSTLCSDEHLWEVHHKGDTYRHKKGYSVGRRI